MQTSSLVPTWKWRTWSIILALAAISIVAWGILLRLSVPKWPWIAPDSGYYLEPALNGGHYYIGPRTFVYPMFCRLAMFGTAHLEAVSMAQRALGLLGPILLFLAWTRLAMQIWKSAWGRALHQALGLAILFLLVPSSISIIYEQEVLLEGINGFLQCVLGALLCLLWLPLPPLRRRLLACCAASLGVFMYYANPRWGAAALVVVVIAALAPVAAGDSVWRRLRATGPVILAVLIAAVSLEFAQRRIVYYNPWDDTFTAKHLLWMHADLAINEFRRDLAAPIPPKNAALLRKMIAKVEEQIVGRGTSHWRTITYNANALLYIADNPDVNLANAFPNDPDGYRRFCLRYYFRIIIHQPRAYWGEVWSMLAYYYSGPLDDGAFREGDFDVPQQLQASVGMARNFANQDALPAFRPRLLAEAAVMDRLAATPAFFHSNFRYIQIVQCVHQLFLPVTLAGAACAILVLSLRRLRALRSLAMLASIGLGSIAVLFAQVLTLAMVTVTEGRYADALRPLATFSLVCAFAMIGSALIHLRSIVRSVRS